MDLIIFLGGGWGGREGRGVERGGGHVLKTLSLSLSLSLSAFLLCVPSLTCAYPRKRNVAAQVAEELKTVTYTTPPMEESRKKHPIKQPLGQLALHVRSHLRTILTCPQSLKDKPCMSAVT